MTRVASLVLVVTVSAGCFRTVYRNLEPIEERVAVAPRGRASNPWRSFFLYGWFPHELAIDAAAECGGAAHVDEIRTRQTFTEGLVDSFANTGGVNVYSPWNAEIVCAPDASHERAGAR